MEAKNRLNANAQLKLVHTAMRQDDFKNATLVCDKLNINFPTFSEGWYFSSLLYMRSNAFTQALDAMNKALSLYPDNYKWQLSKIDILLILDDKNTALELALEISKTDIKESDVAQKLAMHLTNFHCIHEAKALYQKALLITPESDLIYYNLAVMHNYLGETTAAKECCNHSIELNFNNSSAHFLRSTLTRQTNSSNNILELESLLKRYPNNPIDKSKIYFSLAKEYEDCKIYQKSFKLRKDGANLYRKSINYDLKSDLNFIDKIIETYDHKLIKQASTGDETNEPIFVLGLPRSGTTLVERIISSHSNVFSAGELTNFSQQMISMMEKLSTEDHLSRSDMVTLSSKINFKELGTSYIRSTRPQTSNRLHFIDKFPQNSLYIAPIHLALPKARIIIVERHPIDHCYAMYKQLFTDIYQFSYNLDELAEYYLAHHKLIKHWKKLLPDKLYIVRYEDIIFDIRNTSRKMLDFCNLSWEPQCCDFFDNKQVTMTASANQVRDKLYSTSIGMWKNYEHELDSLIQKLSRAGALQAWPT